MFDTPILTPDFSSRILACGQHGPPKDSYSTKSFLDNDFLPPSLSLHQLTITHLPNTGRWKPDIVSFLLFTSSALNKETEYFTFWTIPLSTPFIVYCTKLLLEESSHVLKTTFAPGPNLSIYFSRREGSFLWIVFRLLSAPFYIVHDLQQLLRLAWTDLLYSLIANTSKSFYIRFSI
jgi:hypothetical protein